MEDINICLNCTKKDCRGSCDALRRGPRASQAGPGRPKVSKSEMQNGAKNQPRIFYSAFGEVGSVRYFCEKYGISYFALYARINKFGMGMEAAIRMGAPKQPERFEAFGRRQTLYAWAREYGIGLETVRYRMRAMGMDLETALTTPIMSKAEAGRRKRR